MDVCEYISTGRKIEMNVSLQAMLRNDGTWFVSLIMKYYVFNNSV